VNDGTFADGISAAALAAGRHWPVLLTSQSYVYQESVDTWRALGIHTIYLVGGPAVIGDNIRDWLVSQGLTVHRLAGANRYGTSTAVAGANESLGGRSVATLLFATGRNYPDALASGALAARLSAQLVLVDGAGAGQDSATASWVQPRAGQVTTPYILGGPVAVGGTADQAIQAWLGL
jgi:putative cell wall-binding protein